MQPGIVPNNTQTLSGVGATNPIPFLPPSSPTSCGAVAGTRIVQPGILVTLSGGASLTYSIEVTGDDMDAKGYSPATGNWAPVVGMVGLNASIATTLGAAVTAIRLHVTSWVSGTATFQFVQLT
jgi:hypothetical protein